MLQYIMRSILAGMLLLLANTGWAQDTWMHANGRSFHESGNYRQWNPGLGIEHRINGDWTWAAGWYMNSIDTPSTYAVVKRTWSLDQNWNINLNAGGITGYRGYTVAPVLLPELCFLWVCSFYIPRLGSDNVAAMAFYLRIPVR